MNLTIEEIIDDWMEELVKNSEVASESLVFIKNTMQDGLVSLFEK
jgi:hypothetical protein